MRAERDVDGTIRLRDLSLIVADTLQRMSEFLECNDPTVRARWFPRTYEEDADESHWRDWAGKDLEHLFASNAEIVRKDLARMRPEQPRSGRRAETVPTTFRLEIPAAHATAWHSALNGASHALFIRSGLAPEDMEREPGELGDRDKDVALLRVHLLGYVLTSLLEVEGFTYDPALTEEDPGAE